MTPLVSVVLCSYNQAQYLGTAIESVLSQTLEDIELLLIDNGSTDNSGQVIRNYEGDDRIRVFQHAKNDAVSRRFNEGVKLALAPYISFLYSDDWYLDHKLERQLSAFRDLPPDYGVVYSPALRTTTDGSMRRLSSVGTSGNVYNELLRRYRSGPLDMISPLTKRDALLAQPFRDDIFAEGEAIFYRLALRNRFYYLDMPLAVQRDHASNAGKAIKRNLEMTLDSLDGLQQDDAFTQAHLPSLNRFRADICRDAAWQTIRADGDIEWCRSCIRQSLRYRPTVRVYPKTLATLALCHMPDPIRVRLNDTANRLHDLPNQDPTVSDYGGSIRDFYRER